MNQHTIPIPNPGGGGQYNISSGDEITIKMDSDGYFSYHPVVSFIKAVVPQGDFHKDDTLGPYLVDNQGQTTIWTLSLFDGKTTETCVLTIAGASTATS